jgi:putative MATE family efflux protein
MGLYSTDKYTVNIASEYLIIVSFGFLPYAINMLISTRLRCREKAALPLIFGIMANAINTVLNYVLIFGKLGFSSMGARGAGLATVISQIFNMLLLVISLLIVCRKNKLELNYSIKLTKMTYGKYIAILLPILVTEFMWSLSENVYASVYGHIGTLECAGMTLTYPIQGLMIGALSGLAPATGILIGNELGKGNFDSAYEKSKKLIVYALIGSVVLSIALICLMNYYTDAYDVEQYVKITAQRILQVFAVVLPVKVMNMIIPGGIIKSGGQTKIVMIIELIGTWGVGVPLALLSAYVWKYEIHIVYFILSMEECVRLILSWAFFRSKKWMKKI